MPRLTINPLFIEWIRRFVPRLTWRRADVAWRVLFTALVVVALWVGREAREDLKQFAILNCQEIEQIKTGARTAAWRDFNNLDQTLRILKIEKTTEIVDAAKGSRDHRLAQYKRESCPRRPITRGGTP